MKALVTGATGFIGSRVCARLVRERWDVSVLARVGGTRKAQCLDSRIHVYTHDGSPQSLKSIVTQSSPNVVFHLAASTVVEHTPEQIPEILESNVIFPTQLIDACVRANVKYLVNTGTAWEYSHDNRYAPVCLYAASKHGFESVIDYYGDAHGLTTVTLKLFDVYGPNDDRPKVINHLLRAAKNNTKLDVSPGEQLLDLIHVDDVVQAFLQAATCVLEQTEGQHCRYGVSSGRQTSLKQVVALAQQATAGRLAVAFGARPYRTREVMVPWTPPTSLPGWQPRISLEEGIQQLFSPLIASSPDSPQEGASAIQP